MPIIDFPATKTQREFISSRAYLNFLMGPRGEGKRLGFEETVLTPLGWVKAADIRLGDWLIAGDGSPTAVLGVYPQPSQPQSRLIFSDGTSAVTSDDHLWAVETEWDRNGGAGTDTRDRTGRGLGLRASPKIRRVWSEHRGQKVVTTREIREKLESCAWRHGGRWNIPLVGQVQFPAQRVPLDPYLLGVLLGDGGLSQKSIMLTTADAEIIEAFQRGGILVTHSNRYSYRLGGIHGAISELGLRGHRAWEKFVPAVYLWNSPTVRLAILHGLLDTDGTILKHSNSVSYCTTSERLAEDVQFLVQSLGGIAPIRTRQTSYSYKGERRQGRLSYHVNVCLPNGIAPFRLARKLERVREKGERNRPRRFIVEAEASGEAPGVCFKVAHPSGLFVIHDFIVTHNTTTGLFSTLSHSLEQDPQEWPIRWAVIRDTWENLKITTIASIRDAVRKYGIPAEGLDKLEPKLVRIGMRTTTGAFKALVELHFFGLDQPEDANRLQGFEGAGAWIEEPAPAADLASGIPEDALLAVTSLRQGGLLGVKPRVQITMNPPDKDHWTMKYRDDQEVLERLESRGMTVAFFEIPPGENPGVTEQYRETNRAILEAMGRFDLIQRLVEGKVGYIQLGMAVTPEFGPIHCAKGSLPILRHVPIQRSWDFGLNPTTTFWQITPLGRINIFYSVRGEHMGCEQHIAANVLPWIGRHGLGDYSWEDTGDPNGLTPEARNSNVSAVSAIEEMLTRAPHEAAIFTPGPISIPDRVGPIRYKLRTTLKGGQPTVQVDPEAVAMRRALSGGWHRKKTPAGNVGDIVKDEHSEHGDSIGYGFGVHFPIPSLIERPKST